MNRSKKSLTIAAVLGAAAFWTVARAWAFNPQPDPPAMAAIQMLISETARLYAHCSPDAACSVNPGPCEVALAFRDQQGLTIRQATVMLRPGQTGILELHGTEAGRSDASFVLVPSVRPGAGGRVIPSLQLTDSSTGKTSLYAGPASPRLSLFGM